MNKHEDERGIIEDLLVTDKAAATHITFKKGAVRGNHYHKETWQYDLVISGRLICKTDKAMQEIKAGQLVTHQPNTPHAYLALEDSEMITLAYGPRKGEDYSVDTFKLDTPLL